METFVYEICDREIEVEVDDNELKDALFEVFKKKVDNVRELTKELFIKLLDAFLELGVVELDVLAEWYFDDLQAEFYSKAKEAYDYGQAWGIHCKRYFPAAPLR